MTVNGGRTGTDLRTMARLITAMAAAAAVSAGCAWTVSYPSDARAEAERVAAAVCPDSKYEAEDTSYVNRSAENLPTGKAVYSYSITCSEPYSGPVETPKTAFAGALGVGAESLTTTREGTNDGAWATKDRQPRSYISINFADSGEIIMSFSVEPEG